MKIVFVVRLLFRRRRGLLYRLLFRWSLALWGLRGCQGRRLGDLETCQHYLLVSFLGWTTILHVYNRDILLGTILCFIIMNPESDSFEEEPSKQLKPKKTLTLNNGRLSPSHPEYSQNMSELGKQIVLGSIKMLLLGWNNNPSLIGQMQQPGCMFGQLQVLTLNGNRIVSLEGLSRLCMPELVHLEMCDNWLVSLKSLRKFQVPNLRELNISSIKVVDPEELEFAECHWPNLQALIVNLRKNCYRGIVKGNFELNFGVYGDEEMIPHFLSRRFPKTVPNNYNFLDFVQYF